MNIIQKIVGFVLLAAGAYLGYTAFDQALGVFREPERTLHWLKIREQIHRPAAPQVEEKKSFFKIDARLPSLFSDEQVYAIGGYLALGLGVLVLWVLARISVSFLAGGVRILIGERGARKE